MKLKNQIKKCNVEMKLKNEIKWKNKMKLKKIFLGFLVD